MNSISGALGFMDIKQVFAALVFCVPITVIGATTEPEGRLSPYNRSPMASSIEGPLEAKIKIQTGLRAVFDPVNEASVIESNRLGRFSVLETQSLSALRARQSYGEQGQRLSRQEFLVGLNEETRQRVLLTGNLIVKYASGLNLESLQNTYSLLLVKDFPEISTAFLEVRDNQSLITVRRNVSREPDVVNVRLEELHFGKRSR